MSPENYRMAQPTQWAPAILDYMKKVKSSISTCLAQFSNSKSVKVCDQRSRCQLVNKHLTRKTESP